MNLTLVLKAMSLIIINPLD